MSWPGRFHVINRQPLFVLDGAHNPASARFLRETLTQYLPLKKVVLVIGTSADKDISGMAEELALVAETVIATRSGHPRAMASKLIVTEFKKHNIDAEIAPDVAEGISRAARIAGNNGIVCVAGSLFVVAEALNILGKPCNHQEY